MVKYILFCISKADILGELELEFEGQGHWHPESLSAKVEVKKAALGTQAP